MAERLRVSVAEIERASTRALVAHGAGDWQAAELASAAARAEETGNLICGLSYLESYCTQLRSGRVKARSIRWSAIRDQERWR